MILLGAKEVMELRQKNNLVVCFKPIQLALVAIAWHRAQCST